jgi:hypothetical protein
VTSIGDQAFAGCTNLDETVTLPVTLETLSSTAFNGSSITILDFVSPTPPDYLSAICSESQIKEIIVPYDSVETYKSAVGSAYDYKVSAYAVDTIDLTTNTNQKF